MTTPNLIELEEAVSRIKQACDSRRQNQPSPFFFMVGAGISFPSVPLAPEIVSQCKKTAKDYGRTNEPKGKDSIDLYSHWFETAYGEPNERQRYLRALIEGRQITHANFRLAHLLLNNTITNIVVTTNFDDFLSKALMLFGKRHIVCDHPHMVGRINHTEPDLQIVHLHGTYWFYDCCNLRGELEDRALQTRQTTSTMASLLDMILWDRSPLIIGYSGWEGDVFMDALKRRLDRSLGSTVYWFCYRKNTVDALPTWLKNNANVRFIVPKEQAIGNANVSVQIEGIARADQGAVEQVKAKGISAGNDDGPALPADMVLVKLIRAFDLQAPSLTNDPLGFFAEQLEDSLPKDEASDKDTDIYAIKNVIERVRKAKQRENEETAAAAEPVESSLEPMRDALRRADYREAVKVASQITLNKLSVGHLLELSDAMWASGLGLRDNSVEEIAAYDLVVNIYDRLSEGVRSTESLGLTVRVAKALYNKGVTLGALNRIDEALTVNGELVERFGNSTEPSIREQVASALVGKGFLLGELDRREETLAVYEEVVVRFGDSTEPGMREQVARALVNKGFSLGMLNRGEDELVVYDDVVRRFGELPDAVMREAVARALINKGFRLGALNRSEEAIAVYEEVVTRFGESTEPAVRERVALALINKGIKLGTLNRSDEELAVYDEVVSRFGESPEPALQEQVARALFNKGHTLDSLNRRETALGVYDQVVERYGKSAAPALQEQVAKALNSIGFHSIIEAKALKLRGDEHSAREKLYRAQEIFTAALDRAPDDPLKLGNQAYVSFLLGRKDEARTLLTRAFLLGGERIRDGELKDADVNRLPEDDEFCEMVRSIPIPTLPTKD